MAFVGSAQEVVASLCHMLKAVGAPGTNAPSSNAGFGVARPDRKRIQSYQSPGRTAHLLFALRLPPLALRRCPRRRVVGGWLPKTLLASAPLEVLPVLTDKVARPQEHLLAKLPVGHRKLRPGRQALLPPAC
mmetsp:Transcript_17842/g.39925  ORF Transcript_17842/g.39925 Transcript_17842/m.39925 type:complete len:132 (-) Transcript_17842:243-638(-)